MAKEEKKTTAKKNTAAKKSTSEKKANTKKAPAKKTVAEKEVKKVEKVKEEKTKTRPVVDNFEAKLKENKNKKGFKAWFNKLTLEQVVVGGVIVIAILLIILIGVSTKNTTTSNGKDIVAKLNGKTITADDLYKKLKSQGGRSIMVSMIDEYILDKEYETTDEMKKAAEATVKSYKSSYGDSYKTFLSNYGIADDAELKSILIQQSKQEKAVEDYIKKNISDSEMKSFYDNNIKGDIKASHILISVEEDATDEEKEAAKKKAEDLIQKLKDGADFATLAKENSDDTESAKDGGNLGYFNSGDMVKEFEKAAYELSVDEYTTEPVETTYGYHIIIKTGEKDKPSFEKSKTTVKEKIVEDEKENDSTITAKAMKALREKYKLVIKDKTIKKDYNDYVKQSLTTTTTNTSE